MFKIILISIVLLSISLVGMGINIIFRKGGRFPNYRVGHNKDMKKLGITCVKHDELQCYKKLKKANCESCG